MSDFTCDRLENGLRLITVPMPHLHSAEMHCYVGVGSRDEAETEAGISHFLEHMLFRGTEDYPSGLQLEAAFEAIGGAANAMTDAEVTCYHSRFHPQRIAECARLFASMLCRPLLSDLEVERRIIIEEALEDFNERGEEINPDNLTSHRLWPGHPLGRPTIGNRDSLATIDAVGLQRHHSRYYAPANVVIAVAGGVERAAVIAAVTAAFGDWQGRPSPRPLPWTEPSTAVAGPEVVWVRESDSQIGLQFAFRLPGRRQGPQMPLRLLRRILSGSGTSRLVLRLREELGLTYNVEANLTLFDDSGCLSVDLAIAPESLAEAASEVLQVLDRLRREAVGGEELERVKRSYLYDLEFSRDHADEMAVRYGWGELTGGLRTLEDDRSELGAITAGQLLTTAAQAFDPCRLKVAVVGPYTEPERKRVTAIIAAFGR